MGREREKPDRNSFCQASGWSGHAVYEWLSVIIVSSADLNVETMNRTQYEFYLLEDYSFITGGVIYSQLKCKHKCSASLLSTVCIMRPRVLLTLLNAQELWERRTGKDAWFLVESTSCALLTNQMRLSNAFQHFYRTKNELLFAKLTERQKCGFIIIEETCSQ